MPAAWEQTGHSCCGTRAPSEGTRPNGQARYGYARGLSSRKEMGWGSQSPTCRPLSGVQGIAIGIRRQVLVRRGELSGQGRREVRRQADGGGQHLGRSQRTCRSRLYMLRAALALVGMPRFVVLRVGIVRHMVRPAELHHAAGHAIMMVMGQQGHDQQRKGGQCHAEQVEEFLHDA